MQPHDLPDLHIVLAGPILTGAPTPSARIAWTVTAANIEGIHHGAATLACSTVDLTDFATHTFGDDPITYASSPPRRRFPRLRIRRSRH